MLPNKMRISENATNSLRRLQNSTGLTVNIGARLAFFTSLERGYRADLSAEIEHTGRELDKHTWLGTQSRITELLLVETYPSFTKAQLHDAWASHVDDGLSMISRTTNLAALLDAKNILPTKNLSI